MKNLLVILDGISNKDYNKLPYILKNFNLKCCFNTVPQNRQPDSLTCTCKILGIPEEGIPIGRAYIELLSQGIELGDNDIVFRCNHIKVENGILIGQNSKKPVLPPSINGDLIHLSSYKNLLILKDKERFFPSIQTFYPHEHIGKEILSIMPISANLELNILLRDLILNYNLFPWGVARKQYLPSFFSMYNKTASIICGTEIIKGIAKSMDINCPDVKGATSEIDTDLDSKVLYTIKELSKNDVVILHINGIDEIKHRQNKVQLSMFLEKLNNELFSKLLENSELKKIANNSNGLTINVMSDHETDILTGIHLTTKVNVYEKVL